MALRRWLVWGVLAAGCAGPLHLRPVGLDGDGHALPDLFMGGWDGHRLDAFNDISIEPGVTTTDDLVRTLAHLLDHDYAVIFVVKDKLSDEEAAPHGLFCEAPVCVAVLERKGASSLAGYGATLAVFELTGSKNDVVGSIWIDGQAVRPPGPKVWPIMCRSAADKPHSVHPDGNAYFPARDSALGDGFALFGPSDAAGDFRRNGFAAPDAAGCGPVAPPPEPEPVAVPSPAPVEPVKAVPSKAHRRKHHKDSDSATTGE